MHQKLHLKGRLSVAFPATQFLFYAQSRNEIYSRSSAQSYIFPVTQPLDNCVPCSTLNHLAPLKPANSSPLAPPHLFFPCHYSDTHPEIFPCCHSESKQGNIHPPPPFLSPAKALGSELCSPSSNSWLPEELFSSALPCHILGIIPRFFVRLYLCRSWFFPWLSSLRVFRVERGCL